MKLELNKYIKHKPDCGEIELFREVHNYLSRKHICIFIDETHQQYVRFTSPTTNCVKKKELSDLWVIAYSPQLKRARMTFLQAKFEKKTVSIPFNFKGDYFQYDLLSKRPKITDLSKFNFPEEILSGAMSDSVGSFGVFYFDSKGKIDFAFSIAADISFKKKARCRTRNKQLYFRGISYDHIEIRLAQHSGIELRNTLYAENLAY